MNAPMTKFAIMRANREKQRQMAPTPVPARIPAHQYWNMLIGPGHLDLPKTFTDGGRLSGPIGTGVGL